MVSHMLPTLSRASAKNKRVLVRIDINSDIRNGTLIHSERLTAPLETIRALQKKGAAVVLLAHQGRPGSSDFTSLRLHANFLKKHVRHFQCIPDVIGTRARDAIRNLKTGQVLLLDNVRSVKSELTYVKGEKNELIEELAPLIDIYVNDAFSASHRAHASIVGFCSRMPSYMGSVFERELRAAQKLHVKKALFVLGGSKPSDNLELVASHHNKVLASGLFGPFCLMAGGKKLGRQNILMKKELHEAGKLVRRYSKRIVMPRDLAVEINGKRRDLALNEFPINHDIRDLGIQTIEQYAREIMDADAVFFKGLAGLCDTPAFSVGTEALLRALALCKGFTVVSGGHTLTMLEKVGIPRSKFGYVSLSGGALIHYLAHGTLPGIEALKHAPSGRFK